MSKNSSARLRLAQISSALALLAGVARADLNPDWIAQLPIGSNLNVGIGAMVVAPGGVTYVTGTADSSTTVDVITAAFGTDGVLLWSSTYGGPANGPDQGHALALAPGGILYVAGNTPDAQSYANVLLLKYDAASGALLNAIQYSSGPGLSEYGGSVATDALGSVYVGGGTVGDGADAMVLKFDAAGQFQWKRIWDGPALAPYSQDSVLQIVMDASDAPVVLIHGVMASNHPDYVVVKYDPNSGSTIWETNWGFSGEDSPRDMALDANGDVYVTGTTLKVFSTIKLRGSDGQLLWQEYDSAGLRDSATALTLDGQGGVYITGRIDPDGDVSNFNDNIYTVKRDAGTGALQWSHLYGANCLSCYDVPADVIVDPAGNVFVAGRTTSPPYNNDVITLVLDANTGLETVRGIVSGGPTQTASPSFLRFDGAYNILDGGEMYDFNTGATQIAVFKYGSLLGGNLSFCEPGSVGVIACPCSNPPAGAARGCDNSSSTGGASLHSSGVASLGADTLTFATSDETPTATSIVVQGTTTNSSGRIFGQGVRCVAGSLKRLYVRNASGGSISAPTGTDPSVSARSSTLGDTILAGSHRYYMVYYRDPIVLGGCSALSTYNATNARDVTWIL